MASLNQNPTPVKAETQVADAATIALFKAVWSPEGSPEAQEAALDLHLALAAQASPEGPSAASSNDSDSPPDADSRDWWAMETRNDGSSWLARDMTETEQATIPAADYHGLFDLPPTHTYGPADPTDSGSGADQEIDDASWDRLVDRLALERGWAVD